MIIYLNTDRIIFIGMKKNNADILHWNKKEDASNWWYLLGFIGFIGYLIALIYVLITDNKNRVYSLFYLISIFGAIIVALIFKDKDYKFYRLSFKLIMGTLVSIIFSFIIFLILI